MEIKTLARHGIGMIAKELHMGVDTLELGPLHGVRSRDALTPTALHPLYNPLSWSHTGLLSSNFLLHSLYLLGPGLLPITRFYFGWSDSVWSWFLYLYLIRSETLQHVCLLNLSPQLFCTSQYNGKWECPCNRNHALMLHLHKVQSRYLWKVHKVQPSSSSSSLWSSSSSSLSSWSSPWLADIFPLWKNSTIVKIFFV